MKFTWRGMTEFRGKVQSLKKGMAEIKDAVQQSALGTQREAKIASPVDTGRLRASIHAEIVTRDTVIQGAVGSNVQYAGFQEFGTRYIKPRRYLGGAFDRYKDVFARAIDQIMKRLTRK